MNEVIERLWLGNMVDGKQAPEDFAVLSVMWDNEPGQDHRCHKIITTKWNGQEVFADRKAMDQAADWIHGHRQGGTHVLVHCAYGVERSPLTVVWYLMRHEGMNLRDAYNLVLVKHKDADYRGTWLQYSIRETGELPPRMR